MLNINLHNIIFNFVCDSDIEKLYNENKYKDGEYEQKIKDEYYRRNEINSSEVEEPTNVKILYVDELEINLSEYKKVEKIEINGEFNQSINFSDNNNLKSISFLKGKYHPYQKRIEDYSCFNELIQLPNSLRYLKLGNYNKPLCVLPEGLETLIIGGWDCNTVITGILPSTLEKLILNGFNHPIIKGDLPKSLKYLKLRMFNKEIKPNVLPPNLHTLIFGNFDFPILPKVLPKNLNTFEVGWKFNHPIKENILPIYLKSLIFSDTSCFNQQFVIGSLPENLERLIFIDGPNGGCVYNQKFNKNVLPDKLVELTLCCEYNQPFELGVLPKSLEKIKLSSGDYNQPIEEGVLPANVKEVKINTIFNKPLVLPKELKEIEYSEDFDTSFYCMNDYKDYKIIDKNSFCNLQLLTKIKNLILVIPIQSNFFPSLLVELHIKEINILIEKGVLPETLKKLSFESNFNQNISGIFPKNLLTLELGNNFDTTVKEGDLPDTLVHLNFGEEFNQYIGKNVLPKNLKELIFGDKYNQYIGKNDLPRQLKSLRLGSNFNKIITHGVLPDSLVELSLDNNFKVPLCKYIIPVSLEKVNIYHDNNPYDFDYYDIKKENRNVYFLYNRGILYYTIRDYKNAFIYFKLAANKNYNVAQIMLSHLYENGYGIIKNTDEAKNWFFCTRNNLIKENDSIITKFNLGYLNLFGYGIQKNLNKANFYIKYASDNKYYIATEILKQISQKKRKIDEVYKNN